jgi:hypothetical protein
MAGGRAEKERKEKEKNEEEGGPTQKEVSGRSFFFSVPAQI